jgi:hypothetical protein
MRRQEILINLTLLTVIGALLYVILTPAQERVDLSVEEITMDVTREEETGYDAAEAEKKWKSFGSNPIFQALLTPTPTPTPSPTTPPPTPKIGTILGQWKLMAVFDGEVTIEDRSKTQKDPDNAMFMMTVGDKRPVASEKGEVLNATLKRIDEESDNPSATFGLEGTPEEHEIRVMDDPGAPPQ